MNSRNSIALSSAPRSFISGGGTLTHVPDRRVMRLDSVHLSFQVTDNNTGQPKLLLEISRW